MVERGHVTGHRQHRVGHAEVVGRHVGQALDLAHDVVAEVADDAAVERRELGDASAPGRRASSASSAASAPRSVGTPGGGVPVELDPLTVRDQRERGVATEEREPAPPLGVLDRLEQEGRRIGSAAPASFTNAETGVSRSASTSRHTGTTVWSRASATNSSRDGPRPQVTALRTQTGPGVAPPPKARKKQLRSPVWQAPRPSCSTTNSSASTSQS